MGDNVYDDLIWRDDVLDLLNAQSAKDDQASETSDMLKQLQGQVLEVESPLQDGKSAVYELFHDLVVDEIRKVTKELRGKDIALEIDRCKVVAALAELEDYLAAIIAVSVFPPK